MTNRDQQSLAVSWLQASQVHLLGVVYCDCQAFLQKLQDPWFGLHVHDAHHQDKRGPLTCSSAG
jgi:hypothetical protein